MTVIVWLFINRHFLPIRLSPEGRASMVIAGQLDAQFLPMLPVTFCRVPNRRPGIAAPDFQMVM